MLFRFSLYFKIATMQNRVKKNPRFSRKVSIYISDTGIAIGIPYASGHMWTKVDEVINLVYLSCYSSNVR